MKRIKLLLVLAAFTVVLFSCQSEDDIEELNIETIESGQDTKGIGKALPNGPSTS